MFEVKYSADARLAKATPPRKQAAMVLIVSQSGPAQMLEELD